MNAEAAAVWNSFMDRFDAEMAAASVDIPSASEQVATRIRNWKPGYPLILSGFEMEELPLPLPEGVEILHLARNQLRVLPTLPSSLIVLDCSSNKLEELPAVLPPGLIRLECADNQLTIS
jgi:Leucine-rich repeat (LRR) protein